MRRDSHKCVEDSCCKAGKHSGTCCGKHGYPDVMTAHQHHNTDSTSGTHGTIDGKVCDIENTESKVNTDCHDSPYQTLGSSTRKCVD